MKIVPCLFATALFLFCAHSHLEAQNPELDSLNVTRGIIEGNDTLPIIELPEVRIYERQDFDYLYLKRRYRS